MIITVLLAANICLLFLGAWNSKPRKQEKAVYDPNEMAEKMKRKLREEVGFTEAQVEQYGELRKKNWESLTPMFNELKTAKEGFFNLIYKTDVPDSLIKASADKVTEKQEAIDVHMLHYFRTLRSIAAPEQQPKMDSFLQKFTRKMSGGPRHGAPGQNKDKK